MTSREDELRSLNRRYIEAWLASDVEWYRGRLSEDFVCIESDGNVLDKPAFLQSTARGTDVASYRLDEVDVRFYGDVALVRATGSWERKNGTRGLSRYIDVYARFDGEWKVVSAQITRPPQGDLSDGMSTREIVESYFAALAQKGRWEALLADDLRFTSFTSPVKEVAGKPAYLESTRRFFSMVRSVEVKDLITEGAKVCALTRYELEVPGAARFLSDVAELFTVRSGKIDTFAIYFDTAPFPG